MTKEKKLEFNIAIERMRIEKNNSSKVSSSFDEIESQRFNIKFYRIKIFLSWRYIQNIMCAITPTGDMNSKSNGKENLFYIFLILSYTDSISVT